MYRKMLQLKIQLVAQKTCNHIGTDGKFLKVLALGMQL